MRYKLNVIGLLILSASLLAACGGSGAGGEGAPTTGDEPFGSASDIDQIYATSTAIAAASATAVEESWRAAEAEATPSPEFELRVKNFRFDKRVIIVPAGSTVQIAFVNEDGPGSFTMHNFVIYRDGDFGEKLFAGDLVEGPASVRYSFEAPPPGTYVFLCEPHRGSMFGRFIVQ